MKGKMLKKYGVAILSVFMVASMLWGNNSVYAAYEPDVSSDGIINLFENPDNDSKAMLRYWMPDAGATYDELKSEMEDLYDAGFGGVEVTMVPHNTYFDNSTYGYGSENWINLMKNVLKIAKNDLNGDFQVDFTITAHWPAALNTLDPNDDSAGKETEYAYVKIDSDSVSNGSIDVPMPTIRTTDSADNSFIFQYDLIGAVAAQVTSIDDDDTVTGIDEDTLTVLDTEQTDKTTVAGIPAYGDGYDDYINALYGDNATLETDNYFYDSEGNATTVRKALDDTQYYYTADISDLDISGVTVSDNDIKATAATTATSSDSAIDVSGNDYSTTVSGNDAETTVSGNDNGNTSSTSASTSSTDVSSNDLASDSSIEKGDWVIYGIYEAGTGETPSDNDGFIAFQDPMPGVTYTTNLFNVEGADVLEDFWTNTICADSELKTLLTESGANIFEDSLENDFDTGSIFWSSDMLSEFNSEFNMDVTKYLPYLADSNLTTTETATDLSNDYDELLSDLYLNNHVKELENFFHNNLNCGYRAQAYHTNGITLDTSGISSELDIAEGESLAWGDDFDRFRAVAGGVHLADTKYVSDEALANMMDTYQLTWSSALETINSNYAAGVNRLMIHGTSYAKTVGDDTYNQWPGWHSFGSVFADPWGSRMAYWDDVDTLTDYISRTQSVLQNGTANLDLLVYDTDTFTKDIESSDDESSFSTLLDNGYTYDVATYTAMEKASVKNGILGKVGYKAVIVNDLDSISMEALDKLEEYLQAGLPVVFYGQTPTESVDTKATDSEIVNKVSQLLSEGAVFVNADQSQLVSTLTSLNVHSYASYDEANIRIVRRLDSDGTAYYYIYNHSDEDKTFTMDLEGSGTPYTLDAWTGEITPVTTYENTADGVSVPLELDAQETTIIAITKDTTNFPDSGNIHADSVSSSDASTVLDGNSILLKSDTAGTYETTLSTGDTVISSLNPETAQDLTNWDISLESWGPDADALAPTESQKTTVSFDNSTLSSWSDLNATQEILDTLGVDSMDEVSGIATYTTTVDLGDMDGAYLELDHQSDMITQITVNGTDIGALDQTTTKFDIGEYLQKGENTITVRVVSTMNNRVIVENTRYSGSAQSYGLTSASIQPYDEAVIVSDIFAASNNNSSSSGNNGSGTDNNVSPNNNSSSKNNNTSTNFVGDIQSTIGGHYATNNAITGVACETPKSTFYADLGAQLGSNVSINCVDSECGAAAKQCVNDEIKALINAGVNAQLVDLIDIYAYVNGDSVLDSLSPIRFTLSLDNTVQKDNEDFEIILVQEGGKVTLLQDLDDDPSTITFDTSGFGVFALAEIPSGTTIE